MKLDLNLSSRPFVNQTPWVLTLATLGLAAALWTGLNVYQLTRGLISHHGLRTALTEQQATLQAVETATQQAESRIGPGERKLIREQARFTSGLVKQGNLSWTTLFNHLERVLPRNVRILQVLPNVEDNRIVLRMEADARDNESKLEFLSGLYQPPFDEPMLRSEEFRDSGLNFNVTCSYDPASASALLGGAQP